MLIADHLRSENVIYGAPITSKMDVITRITDTLEKNGDIQSAEECRAALLEREKLMTTAVGNGIALPHAFSPTVLNTVITYMRLGTGVDFEALDQRPVSHIFCILGPPASQGRHLKILARLARLLNHDDFIRAIDEATDPESFLTSFRTKEQALLPQA